MGAGENTMHGLLDRDAMLQLFDELRAERTANDSA